jgi:two-component system, NarL family, response regulator
MMSVDFRRRVHILVTDEHPVVRTGLRSIIGPQEDMTVIAEAQDARQAIRLFNLYLPEVMIVGLQASLGNGLGVLRRVREEHRDARILVMSVSDSDEALTFSLKAGAAGYLVKSASRAQILEAIRSVHRGEVYVQEGITGAVLEGRSLPRLTPRQTQILRLAGAGLSNKLISEQLNISQATVKQQLHRMYELLGIRSRSAAVAVVEALAD